MHLSPKIKIVLKLVTFFMVSLYLLAPVAISEHVMRMNSDIATMGQHTEEKENGTCDMSLAEHLGLLEKMSLAVVPLFQILSLLCIFILFFYFLPFVTKITRDTFYFKKQRHRSLLVLYQELFSQGILNSKAY